MTHIPREQRYRVLKSAKAVMMDQWNAVDCVVRNVSAGGAKIICKDQGTIPDEFRLLTVSDNSIQNVRVIWRHDDMVGLEFTSEKTRAPLRKL